MDLCGVKETAEYSPRWSSGVLFRPQGKYWRISNTWYDFEKFAVKHPGGKHILYISRDRFDDATYAFEAHHMDFERNRDIIKKYRVSDELQDALNMHSKQGPSFSEGNSFYNDLRRRVTLHFKTNKMSTGPTMECLIIFVAVFAAWILSVCNTILNPCIFSACVQGIISALLGSFGHNWIHQPKYKWLAYLSLDTIGLSSDQWYREHVLQHHMYTNTPLDNHFNGTDPFLVANPTVNRSFIQSYILPYLNPIVLFFGIIGNYTTHGIAMWNGEEEFSISKLFFPALFAIYYYYLSSYGLFLFVFQCGVSGVYYFTIALMNHNSYNNHSVKLKNRARDWGEYQIASCADWGVHLTMFESIFFLFLNYHCIHHLFPLVDISHHRDIQIILMQCCKEHHVEYEVKDFFVLYGEMIVCFSRPQSLDMNIKHYHSVS